MAGERAVVYMVQGDQATRVVDTLESLRVNVILAESGREVGQLTERHSPHFLVLDGPLADASGIEALGLLRRADLTTPAVVLCGSRYEAKTLGGRDDLRPYLICRTFGPDILTKVLLQIRMQSTEDDLPTSGRLEDYDASMLLLAALRKRWTGRMVLESGGVSKTIFIAAGRPVFCSSSILAENFGRLLMKRGVISPDTYERARELQLKEGVRQGEALVMLGAISEDHLLNYLDEQVYEKLINGLAWTGGNFELDEEPLGKGITVCRINAVEALIEAYERFQAPLGSATRWQRLRHLWGIGVCERPDIISLVAKTLEPEVLTALQEPFLLCDIAHEQGWEPNRAVAVFTVLEQVRYIELAESRVFLPLARVEELVRRAETADDGDIGTAVTAPRPAVGGYDEAELLIQELYEAYFKLASLEPTALLDVTAGATTDQIIEARERILEKFSLERFELVLDQEEHHNALQWVRAQIEAAAAELLDSQRRRFSGAEVTVDRTTKEVSMQQLVQAEEAFLHGTQLLDSDPCGALEFFEKASRLHSKDPLYLLYHGWSLYRCGDKTQDKRDAEALIRRAVKANPTSVEASIILARVLLDRGETTRARERVRISLAFEPENDEAQDLLSKIEAIVDR